MRWSTPTRSWRDRTSCTEDCPSVARSRPRQPRGGSAHRWGPPRAGSPGRTSRSSRPLTVCRTLCFVNIFYYDKDCCKTIDGNISAPSLSSHDGRKCARLFVCGWPRAHGQWLSLIDNGSSSSNNRRALRGGNEILLVRKAILLQAALTFNV